MPIHDTKADAPPDRSARRKVDDNSSDILPGAAVVSATEPPNPAAGLFWLDTSVSLDGAVITVTVDTLLDDPDAVRLREWLVVKCDCTAGNITVTLPTALVSKGFRFYLKKIDSSANTLTVDASGSEVIDDGLTQVISSQYNTIEIVSDGVEWSVI